MRDSRRSGFTTIELVIVFVVFGIMAALAGPKFYDAFIAAETRTAADRFVRATELARATAVRFGRDAEVHIDAAGKRFWVTVDTTVNLTGVKDTIGPIQNLADTKLTITANPAADTLICFDIRGIRSTRGLCQGGGLAVLFSYTNRVDSVQITTLGKVLR
jgi:Tfp pilus assembly protein FimT